MTLEDLMKTVEAVDERYPPDSDMTMRLTLNGQGILVGASMTANGKIKQYRRIIPWRDILQARINLVDQVVRQVELSLRRG